MTESPNRPIVLYRDALSGHSHRVEMFLRLLDLPVKPIDIDLSKRENRTPAFLAMNLFGQVPVIDDDGRVLADSNAILVYLALRYAPPSWLPRDAYGAARVQRWLSAAAGPLAAGPMQARLALLLRTGQDRSEAIAVAAALFDVMERTLDDGDYLVGDTPTLADLALYSYTAHAPEGNVSLARYPRLRAWLQRIEALPGFVPMQRSAIGLAA